ncbi:MAG TPA: hypothetical protein VMP11_21030 [Verrucomicrobiae bacterium]|nr:hypothetical protein [Verrucomicrobiae bacterium]
MARLVPYILGGIVVGVLLGLIPLIQGVTRGKQGLGIAGFFACILSGATLGLILALPVSLIFLWLVRRQPASSPPPLPPVA